MSAVKPAATLWGAAEASLARSRGAVYSLIALLLLPASIALTDPPFIGDSFAYCADVVRVLQHGANPAGLWEPGHVLWRPLAYDLAPLFLSSIPGAVAWTPALKIGYGLMLLNLLCGMLSAFWIYDLSLRRMNSRLAAMIPVCLFVWGDAVLAYSQSSTSYVVGFAFLMAGIWWQEHSRPTPRIGPAILFGIAALFWLPYVIAIPAACCAPEWIGRSALDRRDGARWLGVLAALFVSTAIVALGVAAAAMLAGIRSLPQFVDWLAASGHGMHQTRQGMRAITGCSRLLLDLGNSGVYLKRFVFHDPYHPMSALATIIDCLGRPILFYGFLAAVLLQAWNSRSGRFASALLAVAALPALAAAILVFEPSSPERFLPVLPFLLITVAIGWNTPWAYGRWCRVMVVAFTVLLPALNAATFVDAFSGWRRPLALQVTEFRASASPNDAFLGILFSEPLLDLSTQHPFDSLNRGGDIYGTWAVGLMDAHAEQWRGQVARFVLTSWGQGRAVWTEKAALADVPPDRLLWVEGDNPNIHWRDIPAFFRTLEFDKTSAGTGEFLRIARTPQNEQVFQRLANLTF